MRGELARFGAPAELGALVERWPAAVGEAIARNAWPARIARDGTLHVSTADSVWAFELAQKAPEIASRLGVGAVRFAPGPLPVETKPAVSAAAVEPTAEEAAEAARLARAVEDPDLRGTIEKALSLALAATRSDRPV